MESTEDIFNVVLNANISIQDLGIMVFGVTAIWLSQDRDEKFRKWASVFGLLGQPFWFYSSFTSEQWGIFFLSFLYSWSWFKGFKLYWLNKEVK